MSKPILQAGDRFTFKPDGATYLVKEVKAKVLLQYEDGKMDDYSYKTIYALINDKDWLYTPYQQFDEDLFKI